MASNTSSYIQGSMPESKVIPMVYVFDVAQFDGKRAIFADIDRHESFNMSAVKPKMAACMQLIRRWSMLIISVISCTKCATSKRRVDHLEFRFFQVSFVK